MKWKKIAEERIAEAFRRGAKNVKGSDVVILVGIRGSKSVGLNCGGCGFENCKQFDEQEKKLWSDFLGPTCIFKGLDLGIALGSAVKIASMLSVDNRIMYRVGATAARLKMLPEATIVMGIPVSAHGKSIYFGRPK